MSSSGDCAMVEEAEEGEAAVVMEKPSLLRKFIGEEESDGDLEVVRKGRDVRLR